MHLFDIAERENTGARVHPRSLQAARRRGTAILENLSQLGSTSAARFEEHVLSTIEQRVSPRWTVRRDVAIAPGKQLELNVPSPALTEARVDALVTDRRSGRSVAIEVRARIRDQQRVSELAEWLDLMPVDVPVIVVVPGVPDAVEELLDTLVRNRRPGVEVLVWDTHADRLLTHIDNIIA